VLPRAGVFITGFDVLLPGMMKFGFRKR